MAVLFITHDMAVVAQMADRVVVMYRGNLVESGPVKQIFEAPTQDYTRALLAAVPRLGEMRGKPRPNRCASSGLRQSRRVPDLEPAELPNHCLRCET